MPAIVNHHRGRPYGPPADTDPRSRSALVAARTLLQRRELTRSLALGTDPGALPELSRRAAQLTSTRNRRILARTLRRTLAEARNPAPTRARVVIVNRREVFVAEDAITTMVGLLDSAMPVHAQGVAIAERMLMNADRSPLYNECGPGDLRRLVGAATAAMQRGSAGSHEFPIAT
jgi:hypothetical protein